jgi:hypothetical protein
MAVNLLQSLTAAKQNLKGTTHRGIVVGHDTADAMGNQQRLVVRVRDVHSGFMDADLPMCNKKNRGNHAAPGIGEVDVPPIGAVVSVTFLDNTLYHSEWDSAPSGSDVGAESVLPGYPDSRGRSDYAGYKIWVNQAAGSESLNINAPDGTIIEIPLNGKAKFVLPNGMDIQSHGDVSWEVQGNFKVSASGSVAVVSGTEAVIAAPSVLLVGSGSSFAVGSTLDFEGSSCNINANTTRIAGSSIVLDAGTVECNAYTTMAAFPTNDNGDVQPTGSVSPGPGGNPPAVTAPTQPGSLTTYSRPTIAFTPNQVDY